ncbi:hypothetical protein GCM10025868_06270 [Angustibacter aerolatus]|uniref:Uncharacterized protein n=1 Tax=Angustibacter aerolatus TaxID=1162965 RepID=A0ABQ6JB15_9ACTN|nr:hypothetical protein GCM10025868_06270 [Angustibacter aerolatus]
MVAGVEVVRTADDAAHAAVRGADVDLAPVDRLAVLLRLGHALDDAADDDRAGDVAAVQRLLLEPDPHERGLHLLGGGARVGVGVLAQPPAGSAPQTSIP